jgi:hypothetical protein
VDTRLRPTHASFELQRTQIPEALMPPLPIVEPFDKPKDLPTGFLPRVIPLVVNEFIL